MPKDTQLGDGSGGWGDSTVNNVLAVEARGAEFILSTHVKCQEWWSIAVIPELGGGARKSLWAPWLLSLGSTKQ